VANFLLAVLIILAIAILVALIAILGFWMKGATVIVLPGLGVLIGTPLILTVLIIIEIAVILAAAYLVR